MVYELNSERRKPHDYLCHIQVLSTFHLLRQTISMTQYTTYELKTSKNCVKFAKQLWKRRCFLFARFQADSPSFRSRSLRSRMYWACAAQRPHHAQCIVGWKQRHRILPPWWIFEIHIQKQNRIRMIEKQRNWPKKCETCARKTTIYQRRSVACEAPWEWWRETCFEVHLILEDNGVRMSKLSFRARQLDANKPLPVYRVEELPDLTELSTINRAVPQMPTGMEKEEETVSYLFIN